MTDITTLQAQRKIKPKVEDVIPFCVAEDKQQIALNFMAWLRVNKMTPGWSGVHNAWDAKCKSKTICKISLRNDGWNWNNDWNDFTWKIKLYCPHIYYNGYGAETIISEGLQSIIWNGLLECIHDCLNGTKPCVGGSSYTFYDKEFTGICPGSLYPEIFDPSETTLNGVKRLLELEKQARVARSSK